MFDAIARVAVIVTEGGVRNYPATEVPELPPCGGRAPEITPEPTDPPLDTP
ncbi:MAG TPA: hypothetical protein VFX65_07225 [Candidatus Limnocylindrales bacterium]|nr:hypothetical protein [Candidatus Limnocylindrales bacterium]